MMIYKALNFLNCLKMLTFIFLYSIENSMAADTFSTYFGTNSDAMDYNEATDTIVFATSAFEIKQADPITKIVTRTLTTDHFSTITCVKTSTDGTLVFTGGTDFRFNIYNLGTASNLCAADQLRG